MSGPLAITLRPQPVLWFGGAVSNRQAVAALRSVAEAEGIPPDQVIGTGDAIAYAGDPVGTLDALADWGVRQIQGNCEAAIIDQANDCGCGFAIGSTCDRLTAAWFAHCRAEIDAPRRAWLATWPDQMQVEWCGLHIRVVHGAPDAMNRFVFSNASDADLRTAIGPADAVVAGHAGIPFSRIIVGKLWHNPGSIGMPANDGTPRTWFSIWHPAPGGVERGGVEIRHRPLFYNTSAALADMEAAGLTQGYHSTLTSGIWPSDEVLPPEVRARVGQPLPDSSVYWRPARKGIRARP